MLGLFRRKTRTPVRFTVRVTPHDRRFGVERGGNLLDAALRCGLAVPYDCRVGACKSCRVRVTQGQARSTIERGYVFSREEIEGGAFLACQTAVHSDLQVDWPLAPADASRAMTAELRHVEPLTPRVSRVALRLSGPADWHAGQYARLRPASFEGPARCYSMVREGAGERQLVIDVTRLPGGQVSGWLSDPARIGQAVAVELPFGRFGAGLLDPAPDEDTRAWLCIAGGSGQGAMAGLLERHLRRPGGAPALLVVGARSRGEVYGLEAVHRVAAEAGRPLRLATVLDDEPAAAGVGPRLDDLLRAAARDAAPFDIPVDRWRALVCGPGALVDSVVAALLALGLPRERIDFDPYEAAAPLASPATGQETTPCSTT